MKYYLVIASLLVSTFVLGQEVKDGEKKSIVIKAETPETKAPISTTPNASLLTKKKEAPQFDFDEKKEGISMLPKEEYLKSNLGQSAVKKANKEITEGMPDLSQFKRDEYLGDVQTNAKTLKIVCRDYQYVDGDRIKITLNDTVIKYNMYLEGGYKAFLLDIPQGFNTIEFEALNMGTSFPNTAELLIFDENDEVLASKQWNLYTGYKASIVIVK